ncbi:AbrB family transcriptional regulator [Paenibacillus antri]|uniref:AbrB family transcriptional regulator n=1 Tax=Paenibacillus antri TaxID=2582848 RepID=A0A5R9GFG4_9BACL|nr:AbrB family transcriptional regulator [Paenibacillus antri]TLS52900.1 AbrB family transcriptional regulator [Paenibacillus antri]
MKRSLSSTVRLLPTFLAAVVGGLLFDALSFPLPWVLGSMAAVLLLKAVRPPAARLPATLKNGALVVLGIVFGLQFSLDTIRQVAPFLLPYMAVTVSMIACCVGLGAWFARWTKTDAVSSVFGFIPGGLTEMVVTGQAVGAKPGTVVFLQTLRLLSVLSVVPFLVAWWFRAGSAPPLAAAPIGAPLSASPTAALWYALPIALAYLLRKAVPASYVLVTMLLTAALHIAGATLYAVPSVALVAAQLVVGAGLGESVAFDELRAVGKQWLRALALVAAMLAIAMGLGGALHLATGMDLPEALLSVAPGGLIEMALTASSIGADAAVVTSLQMVRLYTILGAVPFLLKWWFEKRRRRETRR